MVGGVRISAVELVKLAVIGVDGEDVAVAAAVAASLDRRVEGDGIEAGVALAGVVEAHAVGGLRSGHGDEGYANGAAVPNPGAEIGLQLPAGPMVVT
jgi:hypothetical protein